MKYFALLLSLGLIAVPSLLAEIYVVKPDGTGDFPTIQAAISAVAEGDIIELTDGIFTGQGNGDINFLGKAITVRSMSGDPTSCIVEPDGGCMGFCFLHGEGPNSVLEGVTVFLACYGIWCEDASPTIHNCNLRYSFCNWWWGWGMFIHGGSPTVTDCLFRENPGLTGAGAGVYCFGASPQFIDCTFDRNGGWSEEGPGGGFDCLGGSPSFHGCLFTHNGSSCGYGAMRFSECDTVTVVRCTFFRNRGFSSGGIFFGRGGNLVVSNCTFCSNATESSAGTSDLYLHSANASVENTVIAFGQAGKAVGCNQSAEITLACCDIYGNTGSDWSECIADQYGVDGNISLDPLFCDAAEGNLYLFDASPCAPFSEPNPECGLIGAWPVGCPPAVVDDLAAVPDRPALGPAVPNPFTDRTRLSFALPPVSDPARVRLEICDLNGRRLRILLDNEFGAGAYVAQWDGRDARGCPVPSGAYFCRLIVHGRLQAQRLLRLH